MLEEMNAFYNPWSVLQQPYHPSSGINAAYRFLLAALDQGWVIEQPIQIHTTTRIFRIILTNPIIKQDYVIDVPAIPEVEQIIECNNYPVTMAHVQ